ncbi:hypothetical protein K469DRAFT_787953 [Zopfia rhizophila CBS 207.26]|uniref:Uncharacterized protein n=1 Tax=Zopfia rhizophila CBS 207.26 TaxID=1314779 RepID=A0A6A6DW19_9PEZI|nr:hypothetical protein K469DRAFT_787953 [Zopfia rhizophila CBS 207.26]
MTTNEAGSPFSNFEDLQKWFCTKGSGIYPWNCRNIEDLEVVLKFDLAGHRTLNQVCVSVIDFIRATSHASGFYVSVRFPFVIEKGDYHAENAVPCSRSITRFLRSLARRSRSTTKSTNGFVPTKQRQKEVMYMDDRARRLSEGGIVTDRARKRSQTHIKTTADGIMMTTLGLNISTVVQPPIIWDTYVEFYTTHPSR